MAQNKILNYINSLNRTDPEYQKFYEEIIRFQDEHYIPAVSLEVALFLKWISGLVKPKNILEIGFGSGASACFINSDLAGTSNFISLERDNNRFTRGMKLLERLQVKNIRLLKIDAFKFFETNQLNFDFIFLDSVKSEYHLYIEPVKKILKSNGLLVCDNILMKNKVIEEKIDKKYEKAVKNIDLFNKSLINDEEFNTIFLPIGDGISVSIKK